LYLDLGAGLRPLIALLTRYLPKGGAGQHWTRDGGPETKWMSRIYGQTPSEDFIDDVPRLARLRGPRQITPADPPDLVTFADVKDPKRSERSSGDAGPKHHLECNHAREHG